MWALHAAYGSWARWKVICVARSIHSLRRMRNRISRLVRLVGEFAVELLVILSHCDAENIWNVLKQTEHR